MHRQPSIVSTQGDLALGFFVGFIGSALGLIATLVVMYAWAGSEPTDEVALRRRHASRVSIAALVGLVVSLLAAVVLFVAAPSVVTVH